jgi:hypothetical protein
MREAGECERCSLSRFTWLPCDCLWQCFRVINCNGLRFSNPEPNRRGAV